VEYSHCPKVGRGSASCIRFDSKHNLGKYEGVLLSASPVIQISLRISHCRYSSIHSLSMPEKWRLHGAQIWSRQVNLYQCRAFRPI